MRNGSKTQRADTGLAACARGRPTLRLRDYIRPHCRGACLIDHAMGEMKSLKAKRSLGIVLLLSVLSFGYVALLLLTADESSSLSSLGSSVQMVHRFGAQEQQNLVVEHRRNGGVLRDSCDGRRVYVDDLPLELNYGLLGKCNKSIVSWLDFCAHLQNFGLGRPVEWNTSSGWHGTDAYMLEVIFHNRVLSYPCLTNDSSRADAVFVPYYAGLDALRYLYRDYKIAPTHKHGAELESFLENSDAWKRWNGLDHFMILGRTSWDFSPPAFPGGWGTGILGLPHVANMTTLFIERNPWGRNQVAVPYPTGFHPRNAAELQGWIDKVRASPRRYLFTFSGGIRSTMGDTIRGEVLKQCRESERCGSVDCGKLKCGHDPRPTVDKFLQSEFCLQPRGDTPTRRSAFDALISGCIPVFFHTDSAYTQYVWHLPANSSSYSVLIDEADVRDGGVRVEDVLGAYSKVRIAEMRDTIVTMIPSLIYSMPPPTPGSNGIRDAFDVSLDGVFRRVASLKRRGY